MFEVRVEASFCAAHFLLDYNGKCEALHGHNYLVQVHVRGDSLDKGGMLFDFAKLKQETRAVCNTLDHKNLNTIKDALGELVFDNNPSAERIALFIYNSLIATFEKEGINLKTSMKVYISQVDVFETPTSRASYIAR